MALASNTKDQLAKRLKADLELREPAWTVEASLMADSEPMLTIKDGATVIAVSAVKRRKFNGFNVVAELSSSAAEGLPEHECWLMVKNDQSQLVTAKLAMHHAKMGCSSLKLGFVASPAEASIVDANVSAEIPNDARLGAVGQ